MQFIIRRTERLLRGYRRCIVNVRAENITGIGAVICCRATVGLLFAVFCSLVFVASYSSDAEAKSRTCVRLETQLASLSSGGGRPNSRVRKAIRSQLTQIKIAKKRLRQLGCSKRRLFFFRDAHPSCGRMRGALQRMRNNLAALQSRGSGRASSTKKQRAKIRRAMRRHQCGTRTASRSVVDEIFGKKSKKNKKQPRGADATANRLRNHNTVRTLCVRMCDGYFFPVSFSTKKGSARGDANACERLCPGTEMELFKHKTAGQTADDMVSVATGKPYLSLPNAFAYQKSFNPNCSCNFRKALETGVVAGDEKKQVLLKRQRTRSTLQKIAMPIWRPDSTADPETSANRLGRLDLAKLGTPAQQRPFNQVSQRRVRVVGEAFLPSQ